DGIRDRNVTGVQTCALPISTLSAVIISHSRLSAEETQSTDMRLYPPTTIEWKEGPAALPPGAKMAMLEGDPTKEGPFVVRFQFRSEERRVGKECSAWWGGGW